MNEAMDYFHRLIRTSKELRQRIDRKYEANQHYQIILQYLLIRATTTAESIAVLVKVNIINDATMLLRLVYEIKVNLKYLLLNREINSERYWHWPTVRMYFKLKEILNNKASSEDFKNGAQDLIPKYELTFNEIKKYYRTNNVNYRFDNKYKRSWSGKNISQMADAIGLQPLHFPFYFISSMNAHPTGQKLGDYFDPNTGVFNRQSESNNPDQKLNIILSAANFILFILETVNTELSGDIAQELDELLKEYKQLEKELTTPSDHH